MPLKKAFNRKDILIYPWYISDLVATKEIGRLAAGRVISRVVLYIKNGFTNICYEQKSTDALGRWILEKIIRDRKFYRLVIRKIYYHSQRLLTFCAGLKKLKPEKISNRELVVVYERYEKKLGELRIWGWAPPILDGIFKPYLSDYIMKNFTKFLKRQKQLDKIADYYSLLSASEKMSEVQTESKERLRLLLKIERNKNGRAALRALTLGEMDGFKKRFPVAASLMSKHLVEFGWLTYAYAGPLMSFEYLFRTLSVDLKNGEIGSQLKKIDNHFRFLEREKEKLRMALKLPATLTYLFSVSAELMFIKDYRKGIYQRSYVAMDKIMTELAKRLGLSLREIKFLVLDEIKDALFNNHQKLYQARVKQRVAECCYIISKGKIKVYEGSSAAQIIAKIEQSDKPASVQHGEIKGSIAYAGLARGRVKIILTKADVPKLKTGDILVSSATNPDLISAMKKAAAFVTDTGGIICHAAIVARELKKPCVIGTKIATKVLRDGDLVEVDANQGRVKILKI